MPNSSARFMMSWNTFMRPSTLAGMPVSSDSRAMQPHLVSAIFGNTMSILSPSPDTELMSPMRSPQNGMASTQTWGSGESMAMGKSVSSMISLIIHSMVSSSFSLTEAQQSM